MKKPLFFVAVAALALVSCAKSIELEPVEPSTEELFEYTFAISSTSTADTKATFDSDVNGLFIKWEDGDFLSTFTNSTGDPSGYSYSKSTVNAGNPATFTIKSHYALNKDDMVYCAAPYIASPGLDPTSVSLSIPDAQNQDGDSFDADAMPLVAVPFPISAAITSADGTNVESSVSFYNIGSVAEFDVFSPTGTYSTEKIESITFTTTGTDYIAGSFDFDLTAVSSSDGSKLAIEGYTGQEIEVTVDESITVGSATNKDNAQKVYMVLAPGTHEGTLKVETDCAVYTYTVPSRSFSRGGIRRFGINLEKDSARGPKSVTLNIADFSLPSGSGYKSSTSTIINGNASYAFAYTDCMTGSGIQMKGSSGEFHNTQSMGKLVSISYSLNNANNPNVYFGTTASPSAAATKLGDDYVPSSGDANGFFKIKAGGSYAQISNVVIKYYPLPSSGIAWSAATGTASMVNGVVVSSSLPTLSNDNGVSVSYESSETDVATINGSGVVTILAAGTTEISASFAGNSTYVAETVTYTLTVTDDTMYTIAVSGGITGGSVSASPSSAKVGTQITLTITPNSGYSLATLTVKDSGNNDVTVEDNKFTMPASNVTINATFSSSFTITIASPISGGSVAASASSAAAGATITLTPTPSSGYEFTSWSVTRDDTSAAVSVNGNNQFTMPAANVTVNATFTYVVQASASSYNFGTNTTDVWSTVIPASYGSTETRHTFKTDNTVWKVKYCQFSNNELQFQAKNSGYIITPPFSRAVTRIVANAYSTVSVGTSAKAKIYNAKTGTEIASASVTSGTGGKFTFTLTSQTAGTSYKIVFTGAAGHCASMDITYAD